MSVWSHGQLQPRTAQRMRRLELRCRSSLLQIRSVTLTDLMIALGRCLYLPLSSCRRASNPSPQILLVIPSATANEPTMLELDAVTGGSLPTGGHTRLWRCACGELSGAPTGNCQVVRRASPGKVRCGWPAMQTQLRPAHCLAKADPNDSVCLKNHALSECTDRFGVLKDRSAEASIGADAAPAIPHPPTRRQPGPGLLSPSPYETRHR